ncbi:hypothetical protein BST97_14470 [Nonlabens spongiae]|uniref:Selenophosphate synthetase n=1 Tax=Nonlabens spongiae TaxID=331648 RepID=A0A1W6MNC8_9FLAO|nr:hypothetical protein [Nonlabens spongiae]ARN79098.1 hypothetical protein BST97_14470 [Nonlabens spongiae]
MKKFTFLLLAFFALIACKDKTADTKREATDTKETEKTMSVDYAIAKNAGIEEWNKVKEVHFTFNVERNGSIMCSRQWKWQPKTEKVSLVSKGDTVVYNRSEKLDSLTVSTDRAFINDVYWLLPYFKTQWDEGANISFPNDQTMQVQYTGDGGYTPGDRYDLTFDKNKRITSWDYYPAGSDQPAMTTSFENYQTVNDILIALDHKTPDGSTNIFFTDVEIFKE